MKTGKLHIWVPELIAREGGIQSYSMEMVEAVGDILGPERVTVISKSDRRKALRLRLGGKVGIYTTGNASAVVRTPMFAMILVTAALWERPKLILSVHPHFSPVAVWLKYWRKITCWISAHGVEVWDLPNCRTKTALKKVDKILPVSQFTQNLMVRGLDLPIERFSIIPNTYDVTKLKPGHALEELRKRFCLKGRKVLYTLGRLEPTEQYKGIDEVISVLPQVVREIPNLVYLVGGKGADRARLEEKARSLGVAERVIFLGFVPESEKADYYRLADLFVMPGWGEGFGIVYLESAACGVPVLGSTLDASAEVIRTAEIGEAVNPKNPEELKAAIVRMLKNPLRGPFPGLAQYNRDTFRKRVRALMEEYWTK